MFSPVVTEHWLGDHAVPAEGYAVVVEEAPPLGRSLQLIETRDDAGLLRLTARHAERLRLRDGDVATRAALGDAGVRLGDPDRLSYLPPDHAPRATAASTTTLGPADAEAFEALVATCSPADVEEAYVGLDHELVVGTYAGDRLVSAASAYRWHDTPFGDIGILTASDVRGQGHGAATVRHLAAVVAAAGLEPQYRCDVTNTASAALALAAGFRPFARWWLPEE